MKRALQAFSTRNRYRLGCTVRAGYTVPFTRIVSPNISGMHEGSGGADVVPNGLGPLSHRPESVPNGGVWAANGGPSYLWGYHRSLKSSSTGSGHVGSLPARRI